MCLSVGKTGHECLSIRDERCFLVPLLPPIIVGNDTKDQQVNQNSLAWFITDNNLVLDNILANKNLLVLPWNLQLTKFKILGDLTEVSTTDWLHLAAQHLLTVALI